MLQNRENNTGKIYSRSPKPFGYKVLSFHILDILLYALRNSQPPLSISRIRKNIYIRTGMHYSCDGIKSAITCIANMQEVQLYITEQTATGDCISKHLTKHYSITIKTTNDEPGQAIQ